MDHTVHNQLDDGCGSKYTWFRVNWDNTIVSFFHYQVPATFAMQCLQIFCWSHPHPPHNYKHMRPDNLHYHHACPHSLFAAGKHSAAPLYSESLHPDPAGMWITQEFNILFSTRSSYLIWMYMCFQMICFFHLLEDSILFFYLPKVIPLYIEFAFICLSNSHWIHSGSRGDNF